MIICAAIKVKYIDSDHTVKDLVVCGHRHCNCFEIIHHLPFDDIIQKQQGFIDHTGKFLDRKEALEHFKACGQSNSTQRWYWEDRNQDELYSEDLY
jgi:hypothetical protein